MKKVLIISSVIAIIFGSYYVFTYRNINPRHSVDEEIDNLHGVAVYYNGGVWHVGGKNVTSDGYVLGYKYHCVEFVKRYYYEHLNHKMPDPYGNAKDFFDVSLADGMRNEKRDLVQYRNGGVTKPAADDLVVLSPTIFNRYGHVAIISNVTDGEVEIIQQNPGPFGPSREKFSLDENNGHWTIKNKRILGWLRK